MTEGQRGRSGPRSEDAGTAEVFQAAGENLRSGSRASVYQDGDRTLESRRTRIDEEVELGVAHVHRTQPLPVLSHQPTRHAHGHGADSAGIAAHIDDDAVAVGALLEASPKFCMTLTRSRNILKRM